VQALLFRFCKLHSNGLGRLAATVLVVAAYGVVGAHAGNEEEAAYANFEALCLDHLTTQQDIARTAGAVGLRQIPDELKFPIFGDRSGTAWNSVGNKNRFMLALFENGACGVSAIDADGDGVIEVLRANSRNQQLARDKVGSEIDTMFALTYPDRNGGPDKHALVVVQTSGLKTIGAGTRLTAFSEEAAKKSGLPIPEWPR
jgi:hypothetical protein